jgi:uncharacterized membrane protein YfcA
MSWLLIILGVVLLIRFGLGKRLVPAIGKDPGSKLLIPLGSVAGFVDASGGGGWGPITTPTLLTVTTHEPRKVIGTVSASEFLVAMAASLGFIVGSATDGLDWEVVAGLLLGGVLMAPFAAFLAGRMPHAPFGTLIGGVVIITNSRTLLSEIDASTTTMWAIISPVIAITLVLAWMAWNREHRVGVEHSFYEDADAEIFQTPHTPHGDNQPE